MSFKVGDYVSWKSQAAGIWRTKVGQVVEVVHPGRKPRIKKKDRGMVRDHKSFVVRASVVDGSNAQRKRRSLYWPRANTLEPYQETAG